MPMSPRLLRPRASGPGAIVATDADARAYVLAVNAADGQPLEAAVQLAIDAFVVGCKADGIWSAIKASCILMGARTLSGALTPLVGAAPTNNGPFVSGDYNRKTGLVGNGTTKYLNANRAPNADPQNDCHAAVYKSDAISASNPYWLGASNASFANISGVGQEGIFLNLSMGQAFSPSSAIGLHGASRAAAASFTAKRPGASTQTVTASSVAPSAGPFFVWTINNNGTPATAQWSAARLAFYSIGNSLTLSLLDSRVTTLYNAIGAAIP